jgi:hypothetical protein
MAKTLEENRITTDVRCSDERGREGMLKPSIVQEKHYLTKVLPEISTELPWWSRG